MQNSESRIDKGFYVDMFLAISNMEGIQPRNELDLMQRHEERLLQLGPVLERVHGEFLEMMIDRIFDQIIAAGILPPPPQELGDQQLDVQFISSLALAQRAAATANIERTAAFVTQFSQIPGLESTVDKFDADQAIDEYAAALGAPPKIVRSDDKVQEIRDERAQKQAEAEQMQMMQQAAAMAKDVGGAAAGLGAGANQGVQAAAA
jgi:Asp-tRNA(Asn)/Glu-tRNA(Gln) amidotransferase C subunit